MGEQYESFISKENFILAYNRIKTVKRNEYKEFFYKDFEAFEMFFEKNIDQLINNIQEGIYEPHECEKYYMPKKKNLARPISLICLIDQIVYQALANIIADIFYPAMHKYFNLNIFGNIFKPTNSVDSIFFFERWKIQWKKFNDIKRTNYYDGYQYAVTFDIASFYDLIDHNILCAILKEFNVEEDLIILLKKCFSQWTISATDGFNFKKSCGIPQGPISSSFFSEVYLFKLDEKLRKQKNIKYTRYADDISIMAKDHLECQIAVVYLDLIARDLSLIPQTEKIGIEYIESIDKYIKNISTKFSKISRLYTKNDNKLNSKNHTTLKKLLVETINLGEMDKTIIRFAIYRLNKDSSIRDILLLNLDKMELFYKEIIYYFGKYYPSDEDFIKYLSSFLLKDSVLYQYNKSLIFRDCKDLPYDEDIYRSNYKNADRFWIVKYQLINWLKNNDQLELIVQYDDVNDNYFIQREVNYMKFEHYTNDTSQKLLLEKLISSSDVMISLHGLNIWYRSFFSEPKIDACNDYIKRIIEGHESDYFKYVMQKEFSIEISENFTKLCKKTDEIYNGIKENLRIFINQKNINPSESLMALDLFNNIIFDIISENKGYSKGNFGSALNQLQKDFPIAFLGFKTIHDMRSQRTLAHYKDKNNNPRRIIRQEEYNKMLKDVRLEEVYDEIFDHYNNLSLII